MERLLEDTVALVTGASGNIGLAICEALHRKGARVVATDLSSRVGTSDYDWRALDVTQEQDWADLLKEVRITYSRLDILVNNAGIAAMGKLEDMSLQEWRRTQAINVEGAFLGIKAAVPLLRESGARRTGGAAVINIASGAADRPSAFSSAYCVSKAGLRMLTRAAAVEFAALAYPIRVNSVHPGVVRSEMMDNILQRFAEFSGASVEDMRRAAVAGHPMGRYAEPEEVAEAVVFLASGAARYVHGDALHIDGGYAAA